MEGGSVETDFRSGDVIEGDVHPFRVNTEVLLDLRKDDLGMGLIFLHTQLTNGHECHLSTGCISAAEDEHHPWRHANGAVLE